MIMKALWLLLEFYRDNNYYRSCYKDYILSLLVGDRAVHLFKELSETV